MITFFAIDSSFVINVFYLKAFFKTNDYNDNNDNKRKQIKQHNFLISI